MTDSAPGCAQNADGSLRNASQITWYHDADDEVPIPGPKCSALPPHPFFTGSAKPVGIVVGSRRSARTTRPSARIADPDNVESSVNSGKRKSTTAITAPRKAARLTVAASESGASDESDAESVGDTTSGNPVGNDTEGEDGEGQEAMDLDEYHATKVMADADHAQVRFPLHYGYFPLTALRPLPKLLAGTTRRTFEPSLPESRAGKIPRTGISKMVPSAKSACTSVYFLVKI